MNKRTNQHAMNAWLILAISLLAVAGCKKSTTGSSTSCDSSNSTAVFVAAKDGKEGLINDRGAWVLEPRFKSTYGPGFMGRMREGRAQFMDGDKYGYIDERGQVVIPLKFEEASQFSEGLAAVKVSGAFGYIDKGGEMAIPEKFDFAGAFTGGLAQAQLAGDEKCGYIDPTGKMVIPARFDRCIIFSEGMAAVELRGKMGFIDSKGNLLAQTFKSVGDFKQGLAGVVTEDGKCFWIKKDGSRAFAGEFDEFCGNFGDGLADVKVEGKRGFLDVTGKMVIAPTFERTGGFSEGLSAVQRGGRWGYIDPAGTTVIDFQFTQTAGDFENGLARISNTTKGFGYVNKCGKVIWTNEQSD